MESQSREKSDPHELNNPIPYSVSALILGLTLWAVSYIFWTSYAVEEAEEVTQQAQVTTQAKVESAPVATSESGGMAAKKKSVGKADGKALYSAKCSACHQATGQGLPGVFPPLVGSVWVSTEDYNLPAQIIAKGLSGKITVAGSDYNGVMPAFGQALSSAELAALLTYIRSAWGNKASAVTSANVEESLAKYSEHSSAWEGEAQLIELIGPAK